MTTAVVDNKRRVRIPVLEPGDVVAYQDNGNNTVTLTKVTAEASEPFPQGSLVEYVEEMNHEWAGAKLNVPPPPKDWD